MNPPPPPPLKFKFEVTYNASEGDMGNYTALIVSIRHHLTFRYARHRPVLGQLQREASSIEWFHVVLRSSTRSITVRIRTDTLYLDAFQTETDQWFQFENIIDERHRPIILGFGADYGGRLGETTIGRDQLVTAINYLATTNNQDSRTTRRHLIVLMVMICEATRFHSILYELIAPLFSSGTSTRVDGRGVNDSGLDEDDRLRRSEYVAQMQGWGNLSEAVLRTDAIGGLWFPEFPHMGIRTLENALVVLGMLRFYCWEGDRNWPGRQQSVEGECSANIEGRPMFEVFRLVFKNIDHGKTKQVYGSIKINDGLGSQNIYNRTSSEYESINPNENITLSGPDRSTSALDTIEVDLDLWDNDVRIELFSFQNNKQVSTLWNFLELDNKFDTVLSRDVGNVSFICAVLSNAVAVSFDIKLIDGNGENPAHVYGTITARTGEFQNDRIVLFEKKNSHDYVSVEPSKSIPLFRSAMAVNVRDMIYIEANLWHHNKVFRDKEIANGKATYSATMSAISSGTSNQRIKGSHGEISITLNWEKRS